MTRPADQRFENLNALKLAVNNRRVISRAEDVELDKVRVEIDGDTGKLVVNSRIQPSQPSHWSFGQLARSIGAPAGYLRTLPTDLTRNALNYGLENSVKDELKFMTLRDETGSGINTLQAVTSRTYGRIWDADVVRAVEQIGEHTGGRFFNPKDWSGKPSGLYASDHDVFIFMIDGGSMVDGGGQRDQLNRGFIVWNSEVGARAFGLMTFLFRVVCGNHIIWDAQNTTKLIIRHTSGGPDRFAREAAPALLEYSNMSVKPIEDAITRAKAITLGAEPEVLSKFTQSGFTRGEVKDAITFAKAEEGKCENLWELVQGFTASARSLEWMDARLDLEKRAGALLKNV